MIRGKKETAPPPLPRYDRQEEERKRKRREEQIIKEAELSRAKLNKPPVMNLSILNEELSKPTGMDYNYACDEKLFHVSAHMDKTIRDRILKGDVDVDLAKLLVKKKLSGDSDKLEAVNKEGRSFFVPASGKEQPVINCFKRWEQAFRILSGICMQTHPD